LSRRPVVTLKNFHRYTEKIPGDIDYTNERANHIYKRSLQGEHGSHD
jgi:hypothetical protein